MTTNLHLVLHGVAIKKHGGVNAIAGVTRLSPDVVTNVLEKAAETGRVVVADGKYMLTPAGQMILGGEYSRFYDDLRATDDFMQAYEQFERINVDLKQLITYWQTMDIGGRKVANDHSDREYDDRVIGKLGDLHERFEPIIERMIRHVPRFAAYKDKLLAALEKAEDGAVEWVSDAKLESYHTVWFEMHEDLLRLVGRQREE